MSDPTTPRPRCDLDELEARAKAATPGPWDNHSINGDPIESVWLSDGNVVATWAIGEPRFEFHAPQSRHDAAFIAAANPAVVLELVRRMREAESVAGDAIVTLEQNGMREVGAVLRRRLDTRGED